MRWRNDHETWTIREDTYYRLIQAVQVCCLSVILSMGGGGGWWWSMSSLPMMHLTSPYREPPPPGHVQICSVHYETCTSKRTVGILLECFLVVWSPCWPCPSAPRLEVWSRLPHCAGMASRITSPSTSHAMHIMSIGLQCINLYDL